jgi:hypothetical protein
MCRQSACCRTKPAESSFPKSAVVAEEEEEEEEEEEAGVAEARVRAEEAVAAKGTA